MKKLLLLGLATLSAFTVTGCISLGDSVNSAYSCEDFIKKVEERASSLRFNIGYEHDRVNIHDESKKYYFDNSTHAWTHDGVSKYLEAKYFAKHLKEEAEAAGKNVDDLYNFVVYKKDNEKYMGYIATKGDTDVNGSTYEFDKDYGLLLFTTTRVNGEVTESYSYLYEQRD